jgi:hypothetical protein
MDPFMDHALVCACGGDWTLCHNAIRDVVSACSLSAGIRAEKEKLGLLPARPDDEVLRGELLVRDWRPADIWYLAHPAGWGGRVRPISP